MPFQPIIAYCGNSRTLTFYQALPSRERAESKITSFVVGTATQLLFSLPEERGCKNLPKIRTVFGDSVVSVGAGKSRSDLIPFDPRERPGTQAARARLLRARTKGKRPARYIFNPTSL